MLNSLLNNAAYGLLAVATSILVSNDISDQNYLNVVGKLGIIGGTTAVVKKEKEQIAKLNKARSMEIKKQDYLYESYNNLKTNCQQDLQQLRKTYEQQVIELNRKITHLQQQSHDGKLDLQALSLLCEQKLDELNQDLLKYQVDELKQDLNSRNVQLQKPIQINSDQINKLDDKVTQKEPKTPLEIVQKEIAKPTVIKPKLVNNTRQPKTIILIDEANFYHACKDMEIEPNYRSLMSKLKSETGAVEVRIYVGTFNNPSQKQQASIAELKKLGYQVFEMPIEQRKDGKQKVVGDDLKLACDLIEMVVNREINSEDKIVLVTGDGDYFPALEKVKQRNIDVTLIARQPSYHLRKYVNRCISLDSMKYEICQHKQLVLHIHN